MQRKTIKLGVNLLTAGIFLVIVGTFFHGFIADILFLPPHMDNRIVYLALGWGGVAGFSGILIAAAGLLGGKGSLREDVSLTVPLIALIVGLFLFFALLFSSFKEESRPGSRPGETVVI